MFQEKGANLNGPMVPKVLRRTLAIITMISLLLKPMVQHFMKPLKATPQGGRGSGIGVDPLMVVVFAWTSFLVHLGVRIQILEIWDLGTTHHTNALWPPNAFSFKLCRGARYTLRSLQEQRP